MISILKSSMKTEKTWNSLFKKLEDRKVWNYYFREFNSLVYITVYHFISLRSQNSQRQPWSAAPSWDCLVAYAKIYVQIFDIKLSKFTAKICFIFWLVLLTSQLNYNKKNFNHRHCIGGHKTINLESLLYFSSQVSSRYYILFVLCTKICQTSQQLMALIKVRSIFKI